MPNRLSLDAPILEAALVGLEAQRQRVDKQISELRSALGRRSATTPQTAPPARKRTLSPEGRKRIVEAARKRWAAVRASAGEEPMLTVKQRRSAAKQKAVSAVPKRVSRRAKKAPAKKL